MRALTFLVLAIASSDACLTIVPKDHVFNCPAPNGRGLNEVFRKFPSLFEEFLPKLDNIKSSSVGQMSLWLLKLYQDTPILAAIGEETDYKNFITFLCEKMYIDGDFFVNNTFGAGYVLAAKNIDLPEIAKKKYREEYTRYTDIIRQSEIGVGIDKLLEEAVASDPYVQLAMDYFTSPKFETLKEKVLSLPQLKEFRNNLTNYNINESDVIYLYTRLSLSFWTRKP